MKRVGAPVDTGSKLKPFEHSTKMLSLDNAFNHADLQRFCDRILRALENNHEERRSEMSNEQTSFILEPKIDGLSLALHYKDGNLLRAGTRGDGIIGEDVTETVLQMDKRIIPCNIKSWPQHLFKDENNALPKYIEVRGEIYIPSDTFVEINQRRLEDGLTMYSTARNAAAGNLRRIHNSEAKNNYTKSLKFFAYSLLYSDKIGDDDLPIEHRSFDQDMVLSTLNEMGFEAVDLSSNIPLHANNDSSISKELYGGFIAEQLLNECRRIYDTRGKMDYHADGVVVKVNSCKIQNQLGSGVRTPKWGIAYKFPVEEGNTTLLDIKIQVGRTGVLTPVGILHPIKLGGVVIERVTLHNQDEINRLKLKVGKRVRIIRSGDVIPKVLGCVEDDEQPNDGEDAENSICFSLPDTCPVCGSPSTKESIENGSSVVVRCSGGLTCSAQLIEGIKHYCSRDAVDIKGLGLKIIEQLHELEKVKTLGDLYKLKENDDQLEPDAENKLQNIKGWGEKSVNALFDAIEASRKIPFHKFLYAIGIRGVGKETAKAISVEFISFEAFWKYLLDYSSMSSYDNDDSNFQDFQTSRLHKFPSKAVEQLLIMRRNEAYVGLINDLLEEVDILDDTENTFQKDFELGAIPPGRKNLGVYGKSVVFTGKFQNYTRKSVEEQCRKLGGVPASTVTKGISFVVSAGDRESSKVARAKKLGVKIINEDEWIKLCGDE